MKTTKIGDRRQLEGRAFEEYVGQVYESLGFVVTLNTFANGQQVDIIAKKFNPGQGLDRLFIECKYRAIGSVSNQDVYDFMTFFESVRQKGEADKGVMVTNTSFSAQAKLAAEGKIVLLTQGDLESDLFALKHVYLQIVSQYEQESIFQEYVTVDASQKDTQQLYPNVEDLLCRMIAHKSQERTFFCVLGDYGAGKTTLVQRLRYQFASMFLRNLTTLKPVLFELKNYHKYSDLGVFVTNSLKLQFSREIPLTLFWAELRRRGFIILLDGFDEMSAQVDSRKRLSHFIELSPLLASESPVLLTCRPAYFVTDEEYEQAVATIRKAEAKVDMQFAKPRTRMQAKDQADIDGLYASLHRKYVDERSMTPPSKVRALSLELKGFSEEQIDQYLGKFNSEFLDKCGCTAAEVKAELLAIYDLRDLMRKPILLSMMKDTVLLSGPSFFNKASLRNSAALYETYTDLNFDVDWIKGPTRHLLTKEQRADFAEAIALAMYDRKRLEVTYEEIIEVIKGNQNILKAGSEAAASASAEEVGTDLQLCTFITRTEQETFKFIHKSFMEFFVGRFLKAHISRPIDTRYKQGAIPKEILTFIGCFAMLDNSLVRGLKTYRRYISGSAPPSSRKRERVAALRRNLFGCILYSAPNHDDLQIGDISITELDIIRVPIRNSRFSGTEFTQVTWQGSEFTLSELQGVSFSKSRIEKGCWNEIRGTLTLANESCITRGEIGKSDLTVISDKGLIDESTINETSLTIAGSLRMWNSSVAGGVLMLESTPALHTKVELSGCRFEGVEIMGKGVLPFSCVARDSTFYNCTILNIFISIYEAEIWKKACNDCVGILLIQEKPDELPTKWKTLGTTGTQFLTPSLILSIPSHKPSAVQDLLESMVETVEPHNIERLRVLVAKMDTNSPQTVKPNERKKSGRRSADSSV